MENHLPEDASSNEQTAENGQSVQSIRSTSRQTSKSGGMQLKALLQGVTNNGDVVNSIIAQSSPVNRVSSPSKMDRISLLRESLEGVQSATLAAEAMDKMDEVRVLNRVANQIEQALEREREVMELEKDIECVEEALLTSEESKNTVQHTKEPDTVQRTESSSTAQHTTASGELTEAVEWKDQLKAELNLKQQLSRDTLIAGAKGGLRVMHLLKASDALQIAELVDGALSGLGALLGADYDRIYLIAEGDAKEAAKRAAQGMQAARLKARENEAVRVRAAKQDVKRRQSVVRDELKQCSTLQVELIGELEQILKEAKVVATQLRQTGLLDAVRGLDVMSDDIQKVLHGQLQNQAEIKIEMQDLAVNQLAHSQGDQLDEMKMEAEQLKSEQRSEGLGGALAQGVSVLSELQADRRAQEASTVERLLNRLRKLVPAGIPPSEGHKLERLRAEEEEERVKAKQEEMQRIDAGVRHDEAATMRAGNITSAHDHDLDTETVTNSLTPKVDELAGRRADREEARWMAEAAEVTCAADEYEAQRMRSEEEAIRHAVLEEKAATNTLPQEVKEEVMALVEPPEVEEYVLDKVKVMSFTSNLILDFEEPAREQELVSPNEAQRRHCEVLIKAAEEIEEIAEHIEPKELATHEPLIELMSTQAIREFLQQHHFPNPPVATWFERDGMGLQYKWMGNVRMRRCKAGRFQLPEGVRHIMDSPLCMPRRPTHYASPNFAVHHATYPPIKSRVPLHMQHLQEPSQLSRAQKRSMFQWRHVHSTPSPDPSLRTTVIERAPVALGLGKPIGGPSIPLQHGTAVWQNDSYLTRHLRQG